MSLASGAPGARSAILLECGARVRLGTSWPSETLETPAPLPAGTLSFCIDFPVGDPGDVLYLPLTAEDRLALVGLLLGAPSQDLVGRETEG